MEDVRVGQHVRMSEQGGELLLDLLEQGRHGWELGPCGA
jgi:hypothetical protein